MWKAAFDYEKFFSRFYMNTFMSDWLNTMIIAKFGFFWFIGQPSSGEFFISADKLQRQALSNLQKILKDEGFTNKDVNLNLDSKHLKLKDDK